mgnify:CR=1 FL=1
MKNLNKLLQKLRFLDEEGRLSITNLAMITILTKVALAPAMDNQSIIAMFLALMNYSHKRHELNKAKNLDSKKVQ